MNTKFLEKNRSKKMDDSENCNSKSAVGALKFWRSQKDTPPWAAGNHEKNLVISVVGVDSSPNNDYNYFEHFDNTSLSYPHNQGMSHVYGQMRVTPSLICLNHCATEADIEEDYSFFIKSLTEQKQRLVSANHKIENIIRHKEAQKALAISNNMELLESYKKLQPNWNGYDAAPFNPDFIDEVKRIIADLQIQPEIFPTGRNTIQIEYDKDNDDHLELEIYPDGRITTLSIMEGKLTVEGVVTRKRINTLINEFHAA